MRALIRVLSLVALLFGFTPGMRAQFDKPDRRNSLCVLPGFVPEFGACKLTVQLRDGLGMLEYETHGNKGHGGILHDHYEKAVAHLRSRDR
jgi:hypothetical protein